ncbi:MAG: CBS domain-containing protein [Nitrososphaerales archaeon]|nr:CBS domain-containing protein [Nitrososphaerales archaeon]
MVLDVPAGSIARRELVVIDGNRSVVEAAKLMVEKKRGSILVSKDGEVVGILTERDILRKVVAKSLDPSSTKAKDVMTSPPVTIEQSKPLREAIDLMNRLGIRRMLVTDKGKIVGIFTLRDIVKHTRICLHCGKEIRSILDSEEPDPYLECQCGSRYHKTCAETVVYCVSCARTLVSTVIYPEPSETFGG